MITVRNEYDTVRKVLEGYSLSRFGHAEFNIAFLQKDESGNYADSLVKRLQEILHTRHDGLLIGVPDIFSIQAKTRLGNPQFWRKFEAVCLKQLSHTHEYYSSFFSRPDNCCNRLEGVAIDRKSAKHVDPAYWNVMRKLWQSKRVCVVNCNREMIDAEILNNADRIEFVACPEHNAWSQGAGYQKILDDCLGVTADLFLCSVGAVATVLAHDLHLAGRWAVDFGNTAQIYRDWARFIL